MLAKLNGAMSTVRPSVRARPVAGSHGPAWRPLRITPDGSLLTVCRLGGRTVTCMLDTGAAVSIVDTRHAPPPLRDEQVGVGADWGARRLPTAGPLALGFGEDILVAERPVVADLSSLEALTGAAVALVIGQDILAQRFCLMEFGAGRFALLRTEPAVSARWRRIGLTRGAGGRLLMDVRLDGGACTPAVFDLGSNNAVMMAMAFAEARGLLCDRPTSTAATGTLMGTQIARTFTLASVSLGGVILADPPADAFPLWNDAEAPVNLGLPIFRRFDLLIDIAGGALWFAPCPAAPATFERERSGLGVAFLGDRLRVMHVGRNSPAAFGGWREGEEITRVEGRPVDRSYASASRAAWRSRPAGTAVALEGDFGVRRLVLADYC